MTLSEYVNGLLPFCSYGFNKNNFFIEIIGNFINDAAQDACAVLKKCPDTIYRYRTGRLNLSKDDAMFLCTNWEPHKLSHWLSKQMDESNSYENVLTWLKNNGIKANDVDDDCENLLYKIICNLCNAPSKTPIQNINADIALAKEIAQKVTLLHDPTHLTVPDKATKEENTYIHELYSAYGDAENIANFTEKDFLDYPEYDDDLKDRRTDFYSALSVQRGISELDNELSNQFDVLKQEVLDGVKDTVRRRSYPDGYERMLATMEQASQLPVTNYILSSSPYWIGASIKKGVCHHLVNDKKIKWVKKKHE